MTELSPPKPHLFLVGDSIKANALGRTLSMALTAREIGTVTVLAFHDGETWSGAGQFDFEVRPFGRRDLVAIRDEIESVAMTQPVIAWFSKGADPVPKLAELLRSVPNVRIVADFDDDDVSIMQEFKRSSILNAAKANPLRRKAPGRLLRSQGRLAALSDLVTYSSHALGDMYEKRWGWSPERAVVPHTRSEAPPVSQRHGEHLSAKRLRLGFIGTLRSYKGVGVLVSLLRADPAVQLVTFAQEWTPPRDLTEQWLTYPPSTPLAVMYAQIDALILPMDATTSAGRLQLPAKLVDAAVHSTAVVATPTPPIEEFAAGAYLPVDDWSRPHEVLKRIVATDKAELGRALRLRYEQSFSPEATATQLASRLGLDQASATTQQGVGGRVRKVRIPLLDVWVTPMTAADVVSLIAARPDSPRLLLNHNLHSAYLYRENRWLREFYRLGDVVVIDGWPIFALAALSEKLSSAHRIGSTDWISALWASPEVGALKVFILGGSERVNGEAISAWRKARRVDSVAGCSGYMTADEEQGVVDLIREHDPQLILVGMGMPLQEAFLSRNLSQMPDAYIATVGGAVDYVAGAVKLSPRWLGRLGLEWMWRFIHDPARLYGRYFVEPFKLSVAIMRDLVETKGPGR